MACINSHQNISQTYFIFIIYNNRCIYIYTVFIYYISSYVCIYIYMSYFHSWHGMPLFSSQDSRWWMDQRLGVGLTELVKNAMYLHHSRALAYVPILGFSGVGTHWRATTHDAHQTFEPHRLQARWCSDCSVKCSFLLKPVNNRIPAKRGIREKEHRGTGEHMTEQRMHPQR